MKKILLCCLVLLAFTAHSQNFEGVIKWSMKAEITDPETKAKMDKAAKEMADPANQAKMKEMQAKMNDPQMKAMLDANPQMKAQMEAAMKMAQGGSMTSALPTGMTMEVKGENTLMKVEGGMMPMEILYLKNEDKSYFINRNSKTYSVSSAAKTAPAGKENTMPKPKITKTSETATILGHTCTKYLVETTQHGKTITQSIWTTTEIKDIDMKSFTKARDTRGMNLFQEGIEGVPLRVVSSMPEGNMTMEVTELKKESLPASDFTLPADFKETQGMFR